MRVLLVRPNSIIIATPVPLGLGYIAEALRKERGDEVEILDARNLRWSPEKVQQRIREFRPDVVGLTAISFEMTETHQLAAAIKAEAPNVPIVLGGPYASANKGIILDDKNIDVVVVGEGEATAVVLFTALEAGADLEQVKGVAFRKNGEIVFTGYRKLQNDIDRLQVAWDLINPRAYYHRFGRGQNVIKKDFRTSTIFTSRGCPYNCIFCHNVFGKKFRARSPESVLDEIDLLVNRYDCHEIEFVDDSFNQSLPRCKSIMSGLIDRNYALSLMLPNGIRGDRTDIEFIELLKKANFYRVGFAVESANPRVQEIIKKNVDLEKVRWSIREVAKRKMFTTGYFIHGFPTETYEEMITTANWAASSDLHVASFFYLTPFPGTKLAKMIGRDYTDVRFRDFSTRVINVSAATDEQLYRANKYAYRKFYLNLRRIRRTMAIVPRNMRTVMNLWLVGKLLMQDSVNQ